MCRIKFWKRARECGHGWLYFWWLISRRDIRPSCISETVRSLSQVLFGCETSGLIYESVHELYTVHKYRWGNVWTPKNILNSKAFRMPVSAEFPLMNPKSTWKSAQVDQLRVPPSPHPHSTIDGQCKAPHGDFVQESQAQQTQAGKMIFFSDTVNKVRVRWTSKTSY